MINFVMQRCATFSVSASMNFRKNRDRSNRTGLSKLDFLSFTKNNEFFFARLRRITFSFGNVTATEIKIKLLLVLHMCQRP